MYAENCMKGYLSSRFERRLPRVWSSRLKVKMAVLGTPVVVGG